MFQEIKAGLRLKSPLFQFTLVLFIYSVIATLNLINFHTPLRWYFDSNPTFYRTVFAGLLIFIVNISFYALNYKYLKFKSVSLLTLTITGLTILLILDPKENTVWIFPLAAAAGIFARRRFRYGGKPIFNPAALGIFLILLFTMVFKSFGISNELVSISWWGANIGQSIDFGIFSISSYSLIFIPLLVYFSYKFNKLDYGCIFLGSLLVFQVLNYAGENLGKFDVRNLTNFLNSGVMGTWLFMTFLMISEQRTAPVKNKEQLILGILGALIFVVFLTPTSIVNREIGIVLIMNLLNLLLFSNFANSAMGYVENDKAFQD